MFKKLFLGLFATSVAVAAPIDERWSVTTTEDNGRPIIIRSRSEIPEGVLPSTYPYMIAITWKFQSKSGMPSSAEKERMNDLEDSISSLAESKKQAFLTVIVTGNEVCEWQFYSQNQNEFMAILNQALSGKPVFPIQVSMQTDPEWQAYKQFRSEK